MGCTPKGTQGEYMHESQNLYRYSTRNHRKVVVVSRRMSLGVYSLLGVSQYATTNEIEKAFRKMAKDLHPDKHVNETSQARSARTVKFQNLVNARDLLLDAEERERYNRTLGLASVVEYNAKSTPRVQKHREALSKNERMVVSAMSAERKRQQTTSLARRAKGPSGAKAAAFVRYKTANSNNRYTRRWAVFRRTNSERKSDKRLKKFVAKTS